MNTDQNEIAICSGNELGDTLQVCLAIIKEGDAVNPTSANEELSKASYVVVKRVGGLVVGVGAIKGQRPGYARSVAQKSGFQFDENLHEIGYISVRETHRNQGIAPALIKSLLDVCKIRPLFAITSNETMKSRLSEFGFRKCGNEWQGEKSILSLWIKD